MQVEILGLLRGVDEVILRLTSAFIIDRLPEVFKIGTQANLKKK